MTFRQMIDKVILDAGILEDEMFPEARVKQELNDAQRSVQVKLNGLGLKKWETSSSPSVSDTTWAGYNVSYVSVPTDMLEGDNIVNAVTVSSSISGYASMIDESKFYERIKNTYLIPTAKYPVMVRLDQKLYFFPRPTSVSLVYRKYLPTLTGDSDVSSLPLEYHDLMVKKAVLEIKKAKENQMFIVEDSKLDKEVEETYVKNALNKQEVMNDAK